jgi:hypothetical protein
LGQRLLGLLLQRLPPGAVLLAHAVLFALRRGGEMRKPTL